MRKNILLLLIISMTTLCRDPFQMPEITSCPEWKSKLLQQINQWQYKGMIGNNNKMMAVIFNQETFKWQTVTTDQSLDTTPWQIIRILPNKIDITFNEFTYCDLSLNDALELK